MRIEKFQGYEGVPLDLLIWQDELRDGWEIVDRALVAVEVAISKPTAANISDARKAYQAYQDLIMPMRGRRTSVGDGSKAA